MKTCKSCMKKIDEKAKKCPFCQTDQRGWIARHPILTILGILFITPFIIGGMVGSSIENQSEGADKPKVERRSDFSGTVSFDGTQFHVTSLDTTDCVNARLQINGTSYTLSGYTLEAGQSYSVGAGQFTKGDGTRFNPFAIKPQNFSVSCGGDNELTSAFGYWEFK